MFIPLKYKGWILKEFYEVSPYVDPLDLEEEESDH